MRPRASRRDVVASVGGDLLGVGTTLEALCSTHILSLHTNCLVLVAGIFGDRLEYTLNICMRWHADRILHSVDAPLARLGRMPPRSALAHREP